MADVISPHSDSLANILGMGRGAGCRQTPVWSSQQTRGFDPMLFQCWSTANGAGPTLKQQTQPSSG